MANFDDMISVCNCIASQEAAHAKESKGRMEDIGSAAAARADDMQGTTATDLEQSKLSPSPSMKCENCHHENPAGSKFCANCGKPIGLYCPQCKGAILVGAKFCNHCGHEIAPQRDGDGDAVSTLKRGESVNLQAAVERLENLLIATATKVAGGNFTRAAKLLQIHRTTLHSRIRAKNTK